MIKNSPVLVVDLDNTLIDGDLMISSIKLMLRNSPWRLLRLLRWIMRGKARFKTQLLSVITLDVTQLNYNQTVINYIKQRKLQHHTIILATASHQYYANAVAQHLALFDDVHGSYDNFNLSSHNKAKYLIKQYGYQGFDYIGDHARDIPVWQAAKCAIIVKPSPRLLAKIKHLNPLVLN